MADFILLLKITYIYYFHNYLLTLMYVTNKFKPKKSIPDNDPNVVNISIDLFSQEIYLPRTHFFNLLTTSTFTALS